MSGRITFKVWPVSQDRRNRAQLSSYAAIEQARTDLALEQEFARRVADNAKRRGSSRWVAAVLPFLARRQAG